MIKTKKLKNMSKAKIHERVKAIVENQLLP